VRKDDTEILSDVDLHISPGERLAVIGPNGSGKSSLIKVMIGEYWHETSEAGSYVKLMGSESWDLFDVRKAFGYVSSDLQNEFRKEMTGLEAVISGNFGSIGTNRSQQIDRSLKAKARKALAEVGAAHLANRVVSSLSTGEARRVIIARAIVNDPLALILDEPMTSLDLMGKAMVMDAVRAVARSGKALILVTHDPSEIPPEVDRVVMMKGGRIFLDSDVSAINAENLSALFGVQINVRTVHGRFLAWS
jgi:iron complex transport system ATP-binding protein